MSNEKFRPKRITRTERAKRIQELRELLRIPSIYRYKILQSGNVEVFCKEPEGRYGLKKMTISKGLLKDII